MVEEDGVEKEDGDDIHTEVEAVVGTEGEVEVE